MFQILQKYGCQTPPKSVDPDLCPSKKLFFGHFFWENLSFDPFRHHLPPPMIYIVGKLWISRFMSSSPHTPELNLQAVRFFVTLRESFHHRTSHSVLKKMNHTVFLLITRGKGNAKFLLLIFQLLPHCHRHRHRHHHRHCHRHLTGVSFLRVGFAGKSTLVANAKGGRDRLYPPSNRECQPASQC